MHTSVYQEIENLVAYKVARYKHKLCAVLIKWSQWSLITVTMQYTWKTVHARHMVKIE